MCCSSAVIDYLSIKCEVRLCSLILGSYFVRSGYAACHGLMGIYFVRSGYAALSWVPTLLAVNLLQPCQSQFSLATLGVLLQRLQTCTARHGSWEWLKKWHCAEAARKHKFCLTVASWAGTHSTWT